MKRPPAAPPPVPLLDWGEVDVPPAKAPGSKRKPPPRRAFAMTGIGAGLLITPYAMQYEIAVIAPAVAALAVPPGDSRWLYYLLALLLLSLTLPGLVILLGLLVCVLAPGSLGGSERPQLGEREA